MLQLGRAYSTPDLLDLVDSVRTNGIDASLCSGSLTLLDSVGQTLISAKKHHNVWYVMVSDAVQAVLNLPMWSSYGAPQLRDSVPTQKLTVNSQAFIINKYSGRKAGPFTVLAVSTKGNKVTIARPDFTTGKESFTFKPSNDQFTNDYSGSLHSV